jgi:hypothetical protein
MRRTALLGMILTVAACANPFTTEPSLSGRWAGGSTETDLILDLTLAQTKDGRVQGSGDLEYTWGGYRITPLVQAYGAYDHPHVSLTLTWGQSASRQLTGEIHDGDRWLGSICSSGGGCEPVELRRQ